MSKAKQYRMIVVFPEAAKEKMVEAKDVLLKYGFSVTIQELDV